VKQLASRVERAALWALMVVLLASMLATVNGAPTPQTTSYHLIGFVDQPGGIGAPPVPAGVQVELISRSTGAVYTTTTTGTGGEFEFTPSVTSSALAPGYWGVEVPPQANISLTHCGQCAVLPLSQTPKFAYYNSTQLTNATYSITIPNVSILPYNATLNGTVYAGGASDQGATVSVLDPVYNGLVLANATSNATGIYGPLHLPEGTWVVQTVQISGTSTLTNTTNLTVANRNQTLFSPQLYTNFLSGRILTSSGDVPNAGNATLYDPLNHLVYSTATPPGGYYGFATYPKNFKTSGGANTFDVVLAANGYQTTWFAQTVNATPGTLSHSVHVVPVSRAEMGVFNTTLDFATLNTSNGSGTLNVTTTVSLGNDSALPNLPNATVGQLWAQLGLDYNHSLEFPSADNAEIQAFVNSSGPFFPAPQAGTTVNGTGFLGPNTTLGVASFQSHCTTTCGLDSDATITYSWAHTYALNGTLPLNGTTYVIGLDFQHPKSAADVYNYSFELPKGYVLTANTQAPADAALVPTGPGGTWSSFTLVSKPSLTVPATARFTIVKVGIPTPIVNATVDNFAFSKANVLNSTEGNYSIVVGLKQNVTFSAANSVYPAGTNATTFTWDFGDGTPNVTTNNTTTNHTYLAVPTLASNFTGNLTIHSSGGKVNYTRFHVYVVAPASPVANISSNSSDNYTAGGERYLVVNWSTSLFFNATFSTAPTPDVISIAYFKLTSADGFNESANFSVSAGASNESNWTVQFNGVTGAHSYVTVGVVGGMSVPFVGGWQYNLTLEVWSATGQSNNTTIAILVNDTKPPTASFEMLNAQGRPVPSSGLIEGTNLTAVVRLNASASNNPNGSQIVWFNWTINNTASGFTNFTKNLTHATPFYAIALAPQSTVYTIFLNVTDENGVSANETQNLSVSPNSTNRPILETNNLTSPSGTTLTQGTTYTFWVNVTVGGGSKSAAKNLTVNWYLLGPSGSGSRMYFSGSPNSVVFYNYTSKGVTSSTPWSTVGLIPSLPYGKTVRAVITWNAPVTGNYILYANATATNEFPPDYGTANIASIAIAIHPSVTSEILEYGGIAAVVVVVIVALIWWYRRRPSRRGGAGKPTSGKSGLERGGRKGSSDDDSDS
jgi:hypothetical protein